MSSSYDGYMVNNINMIIQDDELSHLRRGEEVESPQGGDLSHLRRREEEGSPQGEAHSSYPDGSSQINDQECILTKTDLGYI